MAIGATGSGSVGNSGANRTGSAGSSSTGGAGGSANAASAADGGGKTSGAGAADGGSKTGAAGKVPEAQLPGQMPLGIPPQIHDHVELSPEAHEEDSGSAFSHLLGGLDAGWRGDTSDAGNEAHEAFLNCQTVNLSMEFQELQAQRDWPGLKLPRQDCSSWADQVYTRNGGVLPPVQGGW